MNAHITAIVENVISLARIPINIDRSLLVQGVGARLLEHDPEPIFHSHLPQNFDMNDPERNIAYLIDALKLLDPGNDYRSWILDHPGKLKETPKSIENAIPFEFTFFYFGLALLTHAIGLNLAVKIYV